MDSENRLCLLLVGLTELRRRLAMAVHESLSQRLVVRHLALPFSVICYRTQAFPVPCFSAMRWPKVAADSLS